MKKDKKINSLFQLYSNCQGNYDKIALGLLLTMIRGLELMFYVQLNGFVFLDYESYRSNSNIKDFLRNEFFVSIYFILLGVFSMFVIFGSVRAF